MQGEIFRIARGEEVELCSVLEGTSLARRSVLPVEELELSGKLACEIGRKRKAF